MVCVNQTWPHCVNQMGKTQCKPLATRHGMCQLAFRRTLYVLSLVLSTDCASCKDVYMQLKVNGSFSLFFFYFRCYAVHVVELIIIPTTAHI